jgi:hypothetical protein
MASYDPDERRLVLDIGVAGRSHSERDGYLQQLCQCFRTRWRCGAGLKIGPEALELEWLQVEGGLVEGIPVRCRAFVIPDARSPMREYLLRRCDALIFTCRARLEDGGLEAADIALVAKTAHIAGGPPVVIALFGGAAQMWDDGSDSDGGSDGDGGDGYAVVTLDCEARSARDSRQVMTVAIRRAVHNAPAAAISAANRDFGAADEPSAR